MSQDTWEKGGGFNEQALQVFEVITPVLNPALRRRRFFILEGRLARQARGVPVMPASGSDHFAGRVPTESLSSTRESNRASRLFCHLSFLTHDDVVSPINAVPPRGNTIGRRERSHRRVAAERRRVTSILRSFGLLRHVDAPGKSHGEGCSFGGTTDVFPEPARAQ